MEESVPVFWCEPEKNCGQRIPYELEEIISVEVLMITYLGAIQIHSWLPPPSLVSLFTGGCFVPKFALPF